MTGTGPDTARIDTSRAHPARVYDWFLGGKDRLGVAEGPGDGPAGHRVARCKCVRRADAPAMPPAPGATSLPDAFTVPRPTARLAALIADIGATVGRGLPPDPTSHLVGECLAPHLGASDLLTDEQCESDPERYRQHLLHAEHDGSFSLVALVWPPGQGTPVHDHIAWCTTGVHEGREHERRYRLLPGRIVRIEVRQRPADELDPNAVQCRVVGAVLRGLVGGDGHPAAAGDDGAVVVAGLVVRLPDRCDVAPVPYAVGQLAAPPVPPSSSPAPAGCGALEAPAGPAGGCSGSGGASKGM